MIPIIIISHGQMANGIKQTVEMIVGKQEKVHFLCLSEDCPQEFSTELEATLEKYGVEQEVLILADLFGGSPFLTSANLILTSYTNARVIAGVNLPMILECMFSRLTMNVDQLITVAENAGKDAIKGIEQKMEVEVETDGI